MKKVSRPVFLIVAIVILFIATYAVSLSVIANRTISFIPSNITSFLYTYLDTCEKHPENAVTYTHFESENEKIAFSRSNIKILDYELMGAEKVNDSLYAFTLRLQKEYDTYPKRYYFVGLIDGNLCLMVNSDNIPDVLRDGFHEEHFTLTQEDLNGKIPVSADSVT